VTLRGYCKQLLLLVGVRRFALSPRCRSPCASSSHLAERRDALASWPRRGSRPTVRTPVHDGLRFARDSLDGRERRRGIAAVVAFVREVLDLRDDVFDVEKLALGAFAEGLGNVGVVGLRCRGLGVARAVFVSPIEPAEFVVDRLEPTAQPVKLDRVP